MTKAETPPLEPAAVGRSLMRRTCSTPSGRCACSRSVHRHSFRSPPGCRAHAGRCGVADSHRESAAGSRQGVDV